MWFSTGEYFGNRESSSVPMTEVGVIPPNKVVVERIEPFVGSTAEDNVQISCTSIMRDSTRCGGRRSRCRRGFPGLLRFFRVFRRGLRSDCSERGRLIRRSSSVQSPDTIPILEGRSMMIEQSTRASLHLLEVNLPVGSVDRMDTLKILDPENALSRVHGQSHAKQPNESYTRIHRIYVRQSLENDRTSTVLRTYQSILRLHRSVFFHPLGKMREPEYLLPRRRQSHHHARLSKNGYWILALRCLGLREISTEHNAPNRWMPR